MKVQTLRSHLRSILFVVLISLGFFQTIARAESPPESEWIKIEPGTGFELQVDGPKAEQHVPVKLLPDVQWGRVYLQLVDVSIGTQHDAKVFEAFEVQKKDTPAIRLLVSTHSLRPGTYNVIIEARDAGGSKKYKPQQLNFQIICPSAKLQPLPTLYVEQVNYFPLFPPFLSSNNLDIREVGSRSWLTDIQISQLNIVNSPERTTGARIDFNSQGLEVFPRSGARATYTLAKPFPLGATTGIAQVDAPQLAEPVSFNFEVRARLHQWIVFLLIALGVASGYLARVWLQRRVEWNEAVQKGIALFTRIGLEMASHQDSKFVDTLTAERDELKTKLNSKKADEVIEAINKANGTLAAELADLTQRRTGLLDRFKMMFSLTETAWLLPQGLATEIDRLAERVRKAHQQFQTTYDSVGTADKELEEIYKDVAKTLTGFIPGWKISLEGDLNNLTAPTTPLSATLTQTLPGAVNRVKAQAKRIPEPGPASTLKEMSDGLKAIDQTNRGLRAFIHYVPQCLQRTLADVIETLSQVPPFNQDLITRLRAGLDEFTSRLEPLADQPDIALRGLPDELKLLHKSWSSALLDQVSKASNEDLSRIRALLDEYKYADAAAAVAREVYKLRQARLLSGEKVVAPDVSKVSSMAAPWAPPEQVLVQPLTLVSDRLTNGLPEPIETLRIRTIRDIFINRWVQNLIIGVVIIIIGYFIFSEKFVGTLQDSAAIYFWGFGIDMSLSAIMAASGKLTDK